MEGVRGVWEMRSERYKGEKVRRWSVGDGGSERCMGEEVRRRSVGNGGSERR